MRSRTKVGTADERTNRRKLEIYCGAQTIGNKGSPGSLAAALPQLPPYKRPHTTSGDIPMPAHSTSTLGFASSPQSL